MAHDDFLQTDIIIRWQREDSFSLFLPTSLPLLPILWPREGNANEGTSSKKPEREREAPQLKQNFGWKTYFLRGRKYPISEITL